MPQEESRADESSTESRMLPPKFGVAVRMYNTGFGDCFLLAFPGKDGSVRYVLIDCGVHHQFSGGSERMRMVAEDIAKATGKRLHIVAVTHEHTDHITGFKYAEKTFKEIKIDRLWLAWTEDPSNPVANRLRDLQRMRIAALQAAIVQLKAAGSPLAFRLEGVLGFDTVGTVDTAFGLGASAKNRDILEMLRSWCASCPVRPEDYRTPGEPPLKIPGVEGVKCYVLGPPPDIKLINKEEDKGEMYPKTGILNEEAAFMAAALGASAKGDAADFESGLFETDSFESDLFDSNSIGELFKQSRPFDECLMIPMQKAESHEDFGEFFKAHYGLGECREDDHGWRRIDSDWLMAADRLALNINSATNNTSLVLAFELAWTSPPKVLLFAADAQVGNWLYWHSLEWPEEGSDRGKVTAQGLLKRTVLYKVGHHGSLNATLKDKGLEMMESRDLVAMIPVDEVWAKKRDWEHPADSLLGKLCQKSRGRIIRSDKIPADEPLSRPKEASDSEWRSFLKNLEWDRSPDKLWIQFTVR